MNSCLYLTFDKDSSIDACVRYVYYISQSAFWQCTPSI